MDQTPFDIIILAVDLILVLLVMGFIGMMMTISSQMTKSYQSEEDIANYMQEYATFSKYDNTELSGSDAVEAIYMYTDDGMSVNILKHLESGEAVSKVYTDGNLSLNDLTGGSNPVIDLSIDYYSYILFDLTGYVRLIVFSDRVLSAEELNGL